MHRRGPGAGWQVISCAGGSVSLLFEHSFGDGAAWNRWLEAAVADLEVGVLRECVRSGRGCWWRWQNLLLG